MFIYAIAVAHYLLGTDTMPLQHTLRFLVAHRCITLSHLVLFPGQEAHKLFDVTESYLPYGIFR